MANPNPVLFISSRADYGAGGERYLNNVMRHLDRQRFKPIVVLPAEGSFQAHLHEINVETHVVNTQYGWLKGQTNWYRFLKSLPEKADDIKKIIDENDVKLVHTNSNIKLEGMLAANLAGVHHLYAARVDFQPEMELFQRLGLQRDSFARLMGDLSSRILAVSESVAKTLSPPIPAAKIRVIHNGIEFSDFEQVLAQQDGTIRREFGLGDNDVMIVAVGRVAADKGFDTYLQAATEVIKEHPNAHFFIAGGAESPSFLEKLHRIVDASDIGNNVHIIGFRKDIHAILAESDIFVLSSRREGQSNALLEALACSNAVVATRCSGVEEVIQPENTGFTVEIEAHEDMAEKISRLVADKELRYRLATAGQSLIRTDFDLQSKVNELMDFYDEILSQPAPDTKAVPIHMFLHQASELGRLGEQLEEMRENLKQLDQFKERITNNRAVRIVRRIFGS